MGSASALDVESDEEATETSSAENIEAPVPLPEGTTFAPGQGPTPYIEGRHFFRVSEKAQKNPLVQDFQHRDPGKIQVIEFSNYGCYGCSQLHPLMRVWKKSKPSNIAFYEYPVLVHREWKPLAQAFFTVRALGLPPEQETQFDADFFQTIHGNRINLLQKKLLIDFFKAHGVDESQFNALFDSKAIQDQVRQANELSLAYQVAISPALIITGPNGGFMTSPAYVQNFDQFMELLSYLIQRQSPT